MITYFTILLLFAPGIILAIVYTFSCIRKKKLTWGDLAIIILSAVFGVYSTIFAGVIYMGNHPKRIKELWNRPIWTNRRII